MDVILGDSHLDTKGERCPLRIVIVAKLEYDEKYEKWNEKLMKSVETVQMLKNDEKYSTGSTVGNVPTCDKQRHEKLGVAKWLKEHAGKDIAAIVDRTVWEKIQKE